MISGNDDNRIFEVKKEVAKILGVSIDQLEEMLDEIKAEAPQLISDRIALLILMDRKKITNQELITKLMTEYAVLRISDLQRGMRGINIIGRIIRILKPASQKQQDKLSFVMDDGTGRALVSLVGRNVSIFRKVGFEKGDLILLRNSYVSGFIRNLPVITVDDKAEISYVDETDLSLKFGIPEIPYIPPPLSVSEYLKLRDELIKENKEFDIRGVLIARYNIIKIKRKDGRYLRKRIYKLADENDLSKSIFITAWESAIDRIDKYYLGDILVLEGCSIVISSIPNKGERIDIFVGNLSGVDREGDIRKKIIDLAPRERALVFAYNLQEPKIREYETNGNIRKFLYTIVGDDTAVARLVVWDESVLEKLANIKYGDKLRIFGLVREGRGSEELELHISRSDEVIVNPPDFPSLELDKVEEILRNKRYSPLQEIIDDFSLLQWNKRYNIKGYIVKVEESEREGRLSGVIYLEDKQGNRIRVMVWQNDSLVRFVKELPIGTEIVLRSVRSPKEDMGKGLNVIFAGEKTRVEIGKLRKEFSSEEETILENLKLLHEAEEDSRGIFLATITDVLDYKLRIFCEVCGAPVIEKANGNQYICEFGHETSGKKEITLVLLADDDFSSAEIYVSENILRAKNIFYELSDLGVSRYKAELIGKEIIVKGKVRSAPITSKANLRIYAEDIIFPSDELLLKFIKKRIKKENANDEGQEI